MNIHLSLAAAFFAVAPVSTLRAADQWSAYQNAEHGFSAELPAAPTRRVMPVARADSSLYIYQSIAGDRTTKYSIYVGRPRQQGIYERASMDSFLKSHLSGMVDMVNGRVLESRATTFQGRPGLQYRFEYFVDEKKYLIRGISFMVDGGHVRVSMAHASDLVDADQNYDRYMNSFRLAPIAYAPAPRAFESETGITMTPPAGWIEKPGQHAGELAHFTNLARFVTLLAAGTPTYSCEKFESELRASGQLTETATVTLGKQQFLKLSSYEIVPKYNVRLATVQYCLNSRQGAVVVGGSEEESMLWRWAPVFEGAARSLRVR